MMDGLGLLVYGDYAIAGGEDLHLPKVTAALATQDMALCFCWLVPADVAELASSLHEAWQRPYPVLCFGGLGVGADDHVEAVVGLLVQGRRDLGQPPLALQRDGDGRLTQCGNVHFFAGDPQRSHAVFEQWMAARPATPVAALASETIASTLPESTQARSARARLLEQYPALLQRVIAHPQGGFRLRISATSRGKAQAGRKALQGWLKPKG